MPGKAGFDKTELFTPEDNEGLYQSVAFSAVTASSTAIVEGRSRGDVLLFATEDCHIRFTEGASTALATDTFLPANTLVPFSITPGNIISVIRDTLDGTLHISPVL